ADPAGAQLPGQRQLIQRAVGDEADIDAVQRGAEPLAHACEPGDDLGEVLQGPAAAQLPGVAGMVVSDRYQNYFNPRWKREWDECYAPAAMMGWQVQGLP